ncbi:MAG TPA: hypothetical protein VFK37_02470 [Bacillales bacterium]|nr:hypothetical protein [Bacillales bacterium]
MWLILLQGFHVFFAVMWFGGDMFSNFVVVPAANQLDADHSNAFFAKYGKKVDGFMMPMGALTIITGILLGFPLGAWNNIGHRYGNTYLAAFILAALVYLFGLLFLRRNINKAMTHEQGSPEFVTIMGKVKMYGSLIVIGFLAIFVLMVALRYGY